MFFYDLFHKKSHLAHKVISKNNFTYFYILQIINRLRIKKGKVLDIGCGDGTISLFLASNGWSVVGFDVSKKAVDIANKNAKNLGLRTNCKFFLKDIEKITKIDHKFDLIICSEVLEHLRNDDSLLVILSRTLSENGLIIISVPSTNAPLYKLGLAKNFDREVGHLRRYSVDSIKKIVEDARFKIIQIDRTESILRNSLFLFKPLGFFIKFIRGFLVKVFHILDKFLVLVFGESQIFIVAKK